MQNSPLNVGGGSDGIQGKFGLSDKYANVTNDSAVTSATLGGLIGSRALLSASILRKWTRIFVGQ